MAPGASDSRSIELAEGVRIHLGNQLWLERVAIGDLKEQDVNAHVMGSAMFERLAENIRREGQLESVPYCAQPNGQGPIEIISGHHRIRAARAAGMTHVVVLVDRAARTRSQIIAKQLAHNALVGNDDPELVRRLVSQIKNVDDLLATGLNQEFLPNQDNFTMTLFTPHADFQWRYCSFTFLPHQMDQLKELARRSTEHSDVVMVGREEQFEKFLVAVGEFARRRQVVSAGTAIAMLTDMALKEIERLEAEEADARGNGTGTAGTTKEVGRAKVKADA